MVNDRVVGEEIPGNSELIKVHLAELKLFFNAMDHSPLPEKDLDPKAEEFIVSWARSARRDAQFALRVYVDRFGEPDEAAGVPATVHEFFRQRSLSARRRLSQLFRVGRTSLMIGVVCLAIAITVARLVENAASSMEFGALLRESILIGGWVAMWRPLEIFLYDWWPILAERKLFDRLTVMPVTIAFKAGP